MSENKLLFYDFGVFRLDPQRRMLMRNGEPVSLRPKGFDTLLLLVQHSGQVLEKDALMRALWPDSFVEESNLSQHIFVLRKTLGDDQNGNRFIQTIPRRGYKFTASVKEITAFSPEDQPLGASGSVPQDYWTHHSPFRSLQIFEPEDWWLFFGRSSETRELLARLKRSPVLVVTGNSGSGKSSLIRAGLIPALSQPECRDEEASRHSWRIALFRPSASPFDYLAEVLPNQIVPELSLKEQSEFIAACRNKLPQGGNALRDSISALAQSTAHQSSPTRILMVADQFEELFTLTNDPQIRERYIDALLAASRWDSLVPVHLMLILRADFYSHCLEHAGLSRCLENNVYNVPRMTQDQLRQSVEKRLALAGTHAESGLIDSLLDDVGTEPGNLALLEHALSQLWAKCGGFGCTLTNSAYSAIGRLRGALNAHANEVYGAIRDVTQRELTKKIFLELVHLGEDAPDTRRRVRKADLLSLGVPEEIEPLLAHLTASRLISICGEEHESFVEVSHEALIREWSSLREWIAHNREDLSLERRLVQAAEEWKGLKGDPGALLQGARLAQGREWLARHPQAAALVREFVETSTAARVKAEEQKLRQSRWLSYGLVALLVLALGVSWIIHKRQLLAESRLLVAQSEEMLTRDQGRALDVAIRAWNIAKTPEAYVAATKALPQTLNIIRPHSLIATAVFSPSGKRVFTASWDQSQPTANIYNAVDGRLLVTLVGHTKAIVAAQYSPDGQRVLTTSMDHTARVWNANDGRLLTTLTDTDRFLLAKFSADGQQIVAVSSDHTARVWNAADGRLLSTLPGREFPATFSPDGSQYVSSSADNTLRVWSAADGHLLATLHHEDAVSCAFFSPDGRHFITGSFDHTARLWNPTDGRLLATFRHDAAVSWAAFSPDGQQVVTASEDHTARIWDVTNGRLLATLQHESGVVRAEFSSDGSHIVTANENRARIWSNPGGRLLATLQGHSGELSMATFSPDGQFIITGGSGTRVWNTAGGRAITVLQGHTAAIVAAQFSPDGQRVVTASTDSTARIWNVRDGSLLATLQGHTYGVVAAQFSPNGQRVVTAGGDSTARIWNVKDGHLLAILHGHRDNWTLVAAQFSPDGQRVVTASPDHTARIWNVRDGSLLATLQGHTTAVEAAQFSPDGRRVVTASWDHTARLWNANDGRLLATLTGHTDGVIQAKFSPDGQRVVTASADHTARIWNVSDGSLLATLQGHTAAVVAAQFSPDGQRVVTASADPTARVWNAADGRLLSTLEGHDGGVSAATFSPNGQYILTAGYDHLARVWNSSDGHLVALLQGHNGQVLSAMFSPDGKSIVTTSDDQTARIWQVLTLDDIERILTK